MDVDLLQEPPLPTLPIVHSAETANLPLSLLQVSPIITPLSVDSEAFQQHQIQELVSCPIVKLQLLDLCHDYDNGGLQISWYLNSDARKRTEESEGDEKLNIAKGIIYKNDIEYDYVAAGLIHPGSNDRSSELVELIPAITLNSQDPTNANGIPCFVQGYSVPYAHAPRKENNLNASGISTYGNDPCKVRMLNGTLVQILPPLIADPVNVSIKDGKKTVILYKAKSRSRSLVDLNEEERLVRDDYVRATSFHHEMQGMIDLGDRYTDENVLLSFEEETVQALTIRMKMLMDLPIMVGTTHDAIRSWDEQRGKRRRMDHACRRLLKKNNRQGIDLRVAQKSFKRNSKSHIELQQGGTLTVHDPIHGSGKTSLVATIAKMILNCCNVHIINASALFAQYGASGTDAALESLLHGIIVSAAVQERNSYDGVGSVCIILDHLETFVPPSMKGRSTGDPAIPALNSIAAYLSKVVHSLRYKKEFPYPTKNSLYNIKGHSGFLLPVKLCLVGVVTCGDDGGRKGADISYNMGTVLDTLGENRYRVPSTSIEGRCKIFTKLAEKHNIMFSDEVLGELPNLIASITDAKGSTFRLAISKLMNRILQHEIGKSRMTGRMKANIDDVQFVLCRGDYVKKNDAVSISASKTDRTLDDSNLSKDFFSSIGGNGDAKKALEDALAFDERKRVLLEKFGLSPPCGVMMYGPPGTGKTLLAKATARMIQKESDPHRPLSAKGTFISMSASNIVRSEVGQSEKLIVSAFETAMKNAPSVIFIDEFQALFISRDGTGGGGKGNGRLSSTLLQCMDDVSRWRGADESILEKNNNNKRSQRINRVVVFGATNTPWMVDNAFLRPGRFDKVVYVGLPTEKEREAILRVHACRMVLHSNTSLDEVCRKMAKISSGFSGADLYALVRSAAVRCLTDSHAEESDGVELRHFIDAKTIDMQHPSNKKEIIDRLTTWRP